MIQASVRLFCVITCVSAGMPAQRSVVRDDGMRTQQAHAAHAAKRPQSSVPGGQEVRVSDDLAMGSTDESNNETKLTNSEAAGNQANIDTGNGMQLKTFTPGVEDVDGMPASKGEGGYSYVQIEGDLTALGGGQSGSLAEDKEGDGKEPGEEQKYKEPDADTEKAKPLAKDAAPETYDGLFSRAEKGVTNIMHNLNVLAKGAANQQVHLKSHREAIVQLKDKFYELKSAILVKMGILKDRLKKMQDGMGTAQAYEAGDEQALSKVLNGLQVIKPDADQGGGEHKPLQAKKGDAVALTEAKTADQTSLGKTDGANVPYLELEGGGNGGQPPVENGGEQQLENGGEQQQGQGLGQQGEVDGRADTLEVDDDGPEEEDGGGR